MALLPASIGRKGGAMLILRENQANFASTQLDCHHLEPRLGSGAAGQLNNQR
jgi:hypothetical protein